MNRISFPLEQGMQTDSVADLQDGLQLLLTAGAIRLGERERSKLETDLQAERRERRYGEATRELVRSFQEQHELEPRGAVDEGTAHALNVLLEELGAFQQRSTNQERIVAGQVRREDGRPMASFTVRGSHMGERGILRLGEDTTDAEGRYTIRYAVLPGGEAIHLQVAVLGSDGQMLQESEIIREAKALEVVDLVVSGADTRTLFVEGKVVSRVSAGVGGLHIQIVDRSVGRDFLVLADESETDENGAYQVTFTDTALRQSGKANPDLQARAYAGEDFLGASQVRYNATGREILNILLDEKASSRLFSEHETLIRALARHYPGNLADLKETDEQQDLSYLANKTGWDARAVALAALADQFGARAREAGAEIAPAFFYALFRAGLPANEGTLYQTDAKSAESVWHQARAQGVLLLVWCSKARNCLYRQYGQNCRLRWRSGWSGYGQPYHLIHKACFGGEKHYHSVPGNPMRKKMLRIDTCTVCGTGNVGIRVSASVACVVAMCDECDAIWKDMYMHDGPILPEQPHLPCPGDRSSLRHNPAHWANLKEAERIGWSEVIIDKSDTLG